MVTPSAAELDALCLALYTAPAQAQQLAARARLDAALGSAQPPAAQAAALTAHLLRSVSPYTLTYLLTALRALADAHFALFPAEDKVSLRNFLLNYASQNVAVPPYILLALARIFAVVSKLAWFELDEFRAPLTDISKFLSAGTADHKYIGITLLNCLVLEFNQPNTAQRSGTRHRKAAVSFRDTQLLEIFKVSLKALNQVLDRQVVFSNAEQEKRIKDGILSLAKNCLSFDFIGTNLDESADDVSSIQIPSTWRSLITSTSTANAFYTAYRTFAAPQSAQAMECVSLLVCTRRSLFNDAERAAFLTFNMDQAVAILKTSHGLADSENYYEFCRMLARFKTIHHLGEVAAAPGFSEWINLVAGFSATAFSMNEWSVNAIQYLLTFWSKLVSTITTGGSVKQSQLELLQELTPRVFKTFVESRMADGANAEQLEEMFGDEVALITILDLFSNIARVKYDDVTGAVVGIFDSLAGAYKEALAYAQQGAQFLASARDRLNALEVKFTWCVFIIGSMIGGRLPYRSTDEQDLIDGNMTAKVFQLMNVNQSFVSQHGADAGNENLELSFMFFFQMLRKSYIGDHSQRTSKMFTALHDSLGLGDENDVVNLIVQKIGHNLKFWGKHVALIKKTVQLFYDLSSGYSSVKLLRKTEGTKFILRNHDASVFPFLDAPGNTRARGIYYAALCRILFAKEEIDEAEFLAFVEPWTKTIEALSATTDLRNENIRRIIDGLFRDTRGFLSAANTKKWYALFFDWFFPRVALVSKIVAANHDHPVAVCALKFFADFCMNSSSRLNFDVASAKGILLFKETSRVLVTYGQHVINKRAPDNRIWQDKYKGYATCFNIMKRSLAGKYVSFGVFELYNDPCFDEALAMLYRMAVDIPLKDLLAYTKQATSYFQLLEVFTADQLYMLKSLDGAFFQYMIESLNEGIKSTEPAVCTTSCTATDQLFSFVYRQVRAKKTGHFLVQRVASAPAIVNVLMAQLFGVFLFEDTPMQWSLTRPMLPLVQLNKDYFSTYTQQLVASQIPERREALSKGLLALMQGVDDGLATKNRDVFTQHLMNFKREMTTQHIVLAAISDGANGASSGARGGDSGMAM